MKYKIDPARLKPTKFKTAEEKAKWATDLLNFIESDFAESKWTKPLYQQLSNCFMHIAHFNQFGFWDVWFADVHKQHAWLQRLLSYTPVGDPGWTFSDVEREIQAYLHVRPEILENAAIRSVEAEQAADEMEFERLRQKLGK